MSTPAILVAGIGLGVLIVAPLIGVGAVLLADVLTNWHHRRLR